MLPIALAVPLIRRILPGANKPSAAGKRQVDAIFAAGDVAGLERQAARPIATGRYAQQRLAELLRGAPRAPAEPSTVNAVVSRALAAGRAELGTRVAAGAVQQAVAGERAERAAMLRPPLTWLVVVAAAAGLVVLLLYFRRS